MQLQVGEQIDQWLEAQIKKHKVTINLHEPLEPRFEVDISDAAVRGGKNAKVTIVEFSDFECPYCQKANDTLYMLDSIYGDKIKIVYKHFPLSSIHPQAQKAGKPLHVRKSREWKSSGFFTTNFSKTIARSVLGV